MTRILTEAPAPWIYSRTEGNDARFLLGEHRGPRTLICIGINPSTATPERLDNTLATFRNRAEAFGYASWLMLNVYPQRATNPNDLHAHCDERLHQWNLDAIRSIFHEGQQDIWAAWGTLIGKRPYLKHCLEDVCGVAEERAIRWFTSGRLSVKGHPHHPLYLSLNAPLDPFDIKAYLQTL